MIWSNDLAYLVGLIVTDGNLSQDGRHIIFVSKDLEQIQNIARILSLQSKITSKKSGYTGKSDCFSLQFSNVKFYRFLVKLGVVPRKSKILGKLEIPDRYFADFLRGCLDGDGFTYSYWDKRWKASYMLYVGFTCASYEHLAWISETIFTIYGIKGSIKASGNTGYQLVFAKKSSLILIKKLYYSDKITCLSRKWFKIKGALDIIGTLL